jgi:adenylate kinase family enzyme
MRETQDNLNRKHLLRVNVVGTSGTGKSTFARQLAQALGHPYIEMDALFWGPNWTQATDEAFFARLATSLSQPTWILDGNYDRTIGIKWANVTAVIWVDYSFRRTLYQALKRAVVRSIHRKELWPGTGNKESFLKTFFSKESIITINQDGLTNGP